MSKFDFGGYATKNNLKCADGRTIRKDAFAECDGMTVPLVWGHSHNDPGKVLGHAILENRDDGVYTYGIFNDTPSGKNAKELVRHGDIRALSIYANQLVQKGGDVLHGIIREVSLCLAGANPGARIEELSFEHSFDEDSDDFEAILFNGENIVIEHSDDKEPEQEAKKEEKKEEEKMAMDTEKKVDQNEETIADVFNTLSEKQKQVVYFMIGEALNNQNDSDDKDEEDEKVSHNLFEGDNSAVLYHNAITDAMKTVIADGKKYGSLRASYEHHMEEGGALAHAIDEYGVVTPDVSNTDYASNTGHGINGIEYLFPDAKELNSTPEFIRRDTTWVGAVLNGAKKVPFGRIKTTFANITEDDARAKGYLKGNQKKDEFFSLSKRVTTPQTVYKRQRFDRDDIVDITDMNTVAWVKTEMRGMLDEEVARAALIGDGRLISDDDKIQEANIRPIVNDSALFTIKQVVNAGSDDEETAKNAIKAMLKSRKNYKGSGNITFFMSEDWLTSMLLIEDSIGRRLYPTETELAAALRVRRIVPVPVLEGFVNSNNQELIGIAVDMADYVFGMDKGGEVNMFDDFDIDYNRFIYLIETRTCGTLVKPYSAIALFKANSGATTTT